MTQNYMPNNYYNPQMNAYQPQQFVAQQKGITTVAEVTGDEGAMNYPVAAGNTAVLIDFSRSKMWLKTTDIYGRPLPLVPYNITAVESPPVQNQPMQNQNGMNNVQNVSPVDTSVFVTKSDFEELKQMVADLHKSFSE